MADPTRLTKVEMADIVQDAISLRERVDAEWKEGKRDGIRLGLYGAAEAVKNLAAAFDEGDPEMFSLALAELGNARMSLAFHVSAWKRERLKPGT